MPAASEPARVELPHTWRPLGPRVAGIAAGSMLLVMFLVTWVALPQDVRDSFTTFQRITVVVVIACGLAVLGALVRSRAVATEEGLWVVNGYKRRFLAWPEIVAVHLPPGAPWVTLDLADGGTCSVMGIQGSDGARAKQAVRELRSLLP